MQIEAYKASMTTQAPEPFRKRQAQRRLSAAEVSDLIARYKAGATGYDLAVEFGCHRNTVSARLHRAGVLFRNASLTPEQRETVQIRREAGRSFAAIAAELRVEPSTVWRALKRLATRGRS